MAGMHDKNSPSQLKKRYMCPGSYQLEKAIEDVTGKTLPDNPGDAAVRGIILHSLVQPLVEDKISVQAKYVAYGEDGSTYTLTEKDAEHVQSIAQQIRADMTLLDKHDVVIWEHQVDLTELGIKNTKHGNRVDLCFVKPKMAHLEVYEFKFGRTYVDDPQWNYQVKAYAVGMKKKYGGNSVSVHILQPDAIDEDKTIRSYTFTEEELNLAETQIIDIIKATKNPKAPLCKGYHCEYCPVKGACPLWRDSFLNIPQHLMPSDYFKNADKKIRGEFYENLLAAQKWVKDAISEVEKLILGGEDIEGYEIGTGRKSRKWATSEAYLIEHFPSLVIEELMSPAEAEKQHGKKFFKENLSEHVEDEPGKPKVVKAK